MTSSTILATAQGGIPTPLLVVLVVAAIGYVLWRRLQGEPLQFKRLVVLPLVFTVLGVVDLTTSGTHLSQMEITYLVVGACISAALGAARGATIQLFTREGYLWQRYRGVTVALWGALVASKIALAVVANLAGAPAGAGTKGLTLCLGLSLLGEAAVVAPRAQSTGVPFAPDRRHPGRVGPGPFGSGPFGSGQFGSGQFGSGQFGSGQFGSGQFGSGRFGSVDESRRPAPFTSSEVDNGSETDTASAEPPDWNGAKWMLNGQTEQRRQTDW